METGHFLSLPEINQDALKRPLIIYTESKCGQEILHDIIPLSWLITSKTAKSVYIQQSGI